VRSPSLPLSTFSIFRETDDKARTGAAAFLATVATLLNETDKWCILYPTIKRLLRADVKEITDFALLDNAREPVRLSSDLPILPFPLARR
jgi:hypothetical protein